MPVLVQRRRVLENRLCTVQSGRQGTRRTQRVSAQPQRSGEAHGHAKDDQQQGRAGLVPQRQSTSAEVWDIRAAHPLGEDADRGFLRPPVRVKTQPRRARARRGTPADLRPALHQERVAAAPDFNASQRASRRAERHRPREVEA